ncbi:MAG: serine/threonine protein kinase, partial [Phycisphaerales bacterium]|nr:serine/threonine protein kinase [Phycisphaerales bacterium]
MQSDDVTRSIVDPGATASTAPSPGVAASADPDRIREIELLRKLGEGGMGTVWLGRDALLGRDVAVKLLLHATTDPEDPGFRAFLDGARVAASIRSPRLTQIFRADLHDGRPYLVMEFSPGQGLTQLIADRERFTRGAAYAVMGEVCAAVAELHEHGIVHGDIKPANILVESDGRVVVTDFGLTLSLPREHVGAARAHGGTPRYMAPELFDGKATYQSDVYALGIMFFEMLSGGPPFDGSIAAVRELHKTAPLPWERIDPPIGEALRDVIERATHREARLRSKSGRHLLDAIRRALPDDSTWEAGRADLVSAASSPAPAAEQPVPASTRGSSYYEALEMIARDRATGKGPGLSREQEPVAVLAPVATPQLDGVAEHVPCADCGYDLRGVSREGVCPECGLSIEASLDPARLVFADRDWLTRVRRGMFEVLLAPIAVLLIPGFVAFGAAVFQVDSYRREVIAVTM